MILAKLLGEELQFTDVTSDDIVPRSVWAANPAIEEWGLCWRVLATQRVEIVCSIMLKKKMLLGHGCVLEVEENGDNVDVLINLKPICNANREPDFIAVSLPWAKCTEQVCGAAANKQGMTFEGDSPASLEEFMSSWSVMNAARIMINADIDATATINHIAWRAKDKAKKNPSSSRKKRAALESADVGKDDQDYVQETAEPSKPKKRAKVAKESFRSCAELGRATWKRLKCPEPHGGGGKPSPSFEVINSALSLSTASRHGSS